MTWHGMWKRNTRAWYKRAACAQSDPDTFDVPQRIARMISEDETDELREWCKGRTEICEGCPVARQCADDALTVADVGVIRAGVPIPLTSGLRPVSRRREAIRIALTEISEGMPVSELWDHWDEFNLRPLKKKVS